MWKKRKIWDKVYEKSMLRAFARSRAKNGNFSYRFHFDQINDV